MKKFFTYSDPVVPVHHPRVLVETAVAQGADRAHLFEGTGLTETMLASPDVRISYGQYAVLTANGLRLTQNPALGLDVGNNTNVGQMGVVGLAVMSAATIGASLDALLRHQRSITPAWEWEIAVQDEIAKVYIHEAIPLAPFRAFATEVTLASLYKQGTTLLGGPLPVLGLSFAYPRPHYADRYRELADVPMEFSVDVTHVDFDAKLLAHPIAFADPATAALAEQMCASQMPAATSLDGLVAQVKRLLDSTRGRPPSLEALARTLQTSTRTLRRALHDMQTSYHELLDDSRKARAEQWVKTTPLPFEQIADHLGFSDVRSFRRAFKRWTGQTPGALRGPPPP